MLVDGGSKRGTRQPGGFDAFEVFMGNGVHTKIASNLIMILF